MGSITYSNVQQAPQPVSLQQIIDVLKQVAGTDAVDLLAAYLADRGEQLKTLQLDAEEKRRIISHLKEDYTRLQAQCEEQETLFLQLRANYNALQAHSDSLKERLDKPASISAVSVNGVSIVSNISDWLRIYILWVRHIPTLVTVLYHRGQSNIPTTTRVMNMAYHVLLGARLEQALLCAFIIHGTLNIVWRYAFGPSDHKYPAWTALGD